MSAAMPRRRAALLAVVAVLLVLAGIPLTTTAAGRALSAVGITGLSGSMRITSCVRSPAGGHQLRYCAGEFSSDDGTVRDPDATIDADRDPGTRVTVRRTASGTYELGGAAAALGWTAVTFIGLGAVVAGLLCAAVWRRRPALGAPLARLLGLLAAAVLACALASVLGELASVV
ncbi:hypothetical protein POF50_023385 [Streptomyces sp. SL13]|uniref:Uncharacterized protein n=1 Tax=Streptantibioticus silvisoli TaxID=2705255 RepID=A0AA90H834_9ACTN|nr:hypothetical protein [Streptantibioticus silvisoli]MDI5966674.1 hypothetical protein [Streptantibioticus silvisoli]MDI5972242.1 hypothetical protein [Streptantibioticus silvisoli]